MPNSEEKNSNSRETNLLPDTKSLSRREFLRLAGLAGATVGVGAGLGGLLAACGGEETTTTTAGATTTAGVTTTAAATTTVSSGPEAGREIKIGFVTPQTGPIALFGTPDKYCVERWNEAVAEGLVCGDGKNHPVTIIVQDSQSDANRASQVAGDLITNGKVDIILAASTSDTCVPVADQAEALECPCFTNDAPWQAYFFGRNGDPAVGFKWTYHAFWGLEDIIGTFKSMWDGMNTNKVVAGMWPNDADGNVWADPKNGFPGVLVPAGYKIAYGGGYNNGTEDYTAIITDIKKAGAEILSGVPVPPDFPVMWNQMLQQGFKPPVATVGRALLFPLALEAIGPTGYGLSTEVWWTPGHPFKSSLTGETCKEIADDFEKRTGFQWTQPILHYGVFEVAVDALKRTKNVDDKEDILAQISTTKIETIGGPVDFTSPVDMNSLHPVKNVYRTPLVGGQWVKGTTHDFDLAIVNNVMATQIATTATLEPIKYS
ncbi:MAG TPA: ABC transporter substrate-binding protein [Thermoleophilia bacterium]|nr:ABC transporter substrate-binding protein [Thermoleophilia bacterium]